MVFLVPMPMSSSGDKQLFKYHSPDVLFPIYANTIAQLENTVGELKDSEALYANEAEEFVRHLKDLLSSKSIHDDLHQALYPVVQSVKKLLAMKPFDANGLIVPEYKNTLLKLDNQMADLKCHRNARLVVGSVFALLTAVVIAAAITISIMIPGVAIFAPILLGLVAVKPAIFSAMTYSDAYKAHGLLKRLNPLTTALNKQVPLTNKDEATPLLRTR